MFFYSILIYLITPLLPIYLYKRSLKNKKYLNFWKERFGFYSSQHQTTKPIIWLHAVSVGEVNAIRKLVELLQNKYPAYQILITVMTPTGRDAAHKLYLDATIKYVPYDFGCAVKKFYTTYKPKIGLIVETEIWPNLLFHANNLTIPLVLINARLSEKSFYNYQKARFFIRPILNYFNLIVCQDNQTLNHFKKLGYTRNIITTGSIKFDTYYNDKQINKLSFLTTNIKHKNIVAFFSTRDGEESEIVKAMPPGEQYLLFIIPRHPERFTAVEDILKHHSVKYQKRTQNMPIKHDTRVLIGDTLGEMMQYLHLCDIAVTGGSFGGYGGQNIIEPIILQKPVIFGKSMFNFKTISECALLYNCALEVDSFTGCFEIINELLGDNIKYTHMKHGCEKFIKDNTGASNQIIKAIAKYL